MGVPVFVERPFPNQEIRSNLERLIDERAGEVVMEEEGPVDGASEVLLMVAFPDEARAQAFARSAELLPRVSAEVVTLFRVRSEVLYGE